MVTNVIAFLCLICICIKLYYTYKIEKLNDSNWSIILRVLGSIYSASFFFPILRKTDNKKEISLIQKANIAIYLFWLLFVFQLIYIVVSVL